MHPGKVNQTDVNSPSMFTFREGASDTALWALILSTVESSVYLRHWEIEMVAICGSVIERKYTENAVHVPYAVNAK